MTPKGKGRAGGRMKRDLEPFTFYLGTDERETLRDIAQRDGKTLSDVIRDAAREYIVRDKAKHAKAGH